MYIILQFLIERNERERYRHAKKVFILHNILFYKSIHGAYFIKIKTKQNKTKQRLRYGAYDIIDSQNIII